MLLQIWMHSIDRRYPLTLRLKNDPKRVLNVIVTDLHLPKDDPEALEFEGDEAQFGHYICGHIDHQDPENCWINILPPRL